MKKYIYICFVVVSFIVIPLFASCGNQKDVNDMNFNEYTTDDIKALSTITKKYDLNELKAFFKGSNANENIGFESTTSTLTFSEVNLRYPVEIIRSGGYSVYKVSQGGYFYVFWVKSLATLTDRLNSEPSVYFSAYLPFDLPQSSFDSLTPGSSTAEDVQRIDPSFELSFLNSNGIFSYSYINDKTILQIEYTCREKIDGYDDLIVKEKTVVARNSVSSRYSAILSSDLPL